MSLIVRYLDFPRCAQNAQSNDRTDTYRDTETSAQQYFELLFSHYKPVKKPAGILPCQKAR